MPLKKVSIVISLAFCLINCTPTPSLVKMVPDLNSSHYVAKNATIKIADFAGGESTNAWTGSKIDAKSFRAALSMALKKSKIFTDVLDTGSADYTLNAILISQDQPAIGLNMTSSLWVKYYLLDSSGEKELWVKDISKDYTAAFSSSCTGASRLNKANEGVARENIEAFINELSQATL